MKPEYNFKIYTDGGSRGNPGPAAYGFVVYDSSDKIVYEEGKTLGVQTNNYAEYMAVVASLKYVLEHLTINHQPSTINFFMDSKLVCEQMSGRWKIKNEALRSLYYTVKDLEQRLGAKISYTHVFREQNKEADRMVNVALDAEI